MKSGVPLTPGKLLHPYPVPMDSKQPEASANDWHYAGNNLRRLKASGVYYAFAKRAGKQFSLSLNTTDKATAIPLRNDWLRDLYAIASPEAAKLTFAEVAARWIDADRHTLKDSSATRRAACVKVLDPFFSGLQIRHCTAR